MRAIKYIAAFLLLISAIGEAIAIEPRIIGILEETPSGDWNSPLQNQVRIGFEKVGFDWMPLRCRNSKEAAGAACSNLGRRETPARWNIYYQGKFQCAIQSGAWVGSDSAHDSALSHMPGPVPAVGKPSKDFSGWMNADAHRPLIAVNSTLPPFASRWRRDTPHPELLSAIWPAFRSVISIVDTCTEGSGARTYYTLRSSDLKSMPGWRSRSGELLLRFGVDPRLQPDCGEIQDSPDLWFYRSGGGTIRVLAGQTWDKSESSNFTPSLDLVDIGDFAGDKNEEALFFFSGYNYDGYVLCYDHFRKAARFGWHYH